MDTIKSLRVGSLSSMMQGGIALKIISYNTDGKIVNNGKPEFP